MAESFEAKVDRWAATDYATFATAYDDYVTGCTDGEFAAVVWAKAFKSALSNFKARTGYVSAYAAEVCKDIASDVTIKVAKAARKADGAYSDAWTWYVTSNAKTAASNVRRNNAKNARKTAKAEAVAKTSYGSNEDYSDLYAAIEALDPAWAEVVKAKFFDGKSRVAIAAEMGVTEGAIRKKEAKALKALATALA